MGVMDKFLNYMKLNDEEDEGFYDDDYLDDEEEVEPVKKFSPAKSRQQAQEDDEPEEKSKRSSQPKVTPVSYTHLSGASFRSPTHTLYKYIPEISVIPGNGSRHVFRSGGSPPFFYGHSDACRWAGRDVYKRQILFAAIT